MRGRPRLTEEAAAAEAARIINVAWALKYRPQGLKAFGFTRVQAAKDYIKRRRRGRVGELVGNTVRDLFPAENRVQVAVSLVLDHELTRYRAAKMVDVDLTNLTRAMAAGVAQRKVSRERIAALNTMVTDGPH